MFLKSSTPEHSAAGSTVRTVLFRTKKIRNSEYYKENRESLKAKKVRYDFKIELNKEEVDRLESLKMKITSINKELHLDKKKRTCSKRSFYGNFSRQLACT